MAKRYGRNQKRRHREAIAEQAAQLSQLARQMRYAEHRAENARNEAFNEFIKDTDLYKYALGECSYGLGRALGEQLNGHADKLLPMVLKEPMKFSYEVNAMAQSREERNVVTVRIPLRELIYRRIV